MKIVPPDFVKYRAAADLVRGVFAKYDPDFSAASLDEAYLDLTDYMASLNHNAAVEGNVPTVSFAPLLLMRFYKESVQKITRGEYFSI